jgi:hypothetical protein
MVEKQKESNEEKRREKRGRQRLQAGLQKKLTRPREGANLNLCNHRKPLSALKPAWPHVDWSLLTDEEDTLAPSEYRLDLVEEVQVVRKRGRAFLTFLEGHPEDFIIVVSHSGFIRCLAAEVLGWEAHLSHPSLSTGENLVMEFADNKWNYESKAEPSVIPPRKVAH